MSPSGVVRAPRALAVVLGCPALAAAAYGCAAREAAPARAAEIIVPDRDAGEPPEGSSQAEIAEAAPAAVASEDVPAPDLSPVWSTAGDPSLRHAEELAAARALRARLARGTMRAADAGAPALLSFTTAQALVERTSAAYARAASAPDATDAGRVEAMSEAADVMIGWATSLDRQGLATLPPAWRTDPSLRVSFEDVAQGPTKRWRAEGAALARHCAKVAEDAHLSTAAATACRSLHAHVGRVVKASPGSAKSADAGASGCACHPLDPLCSSSLGPWCPR